MQHGAVRLHEPRHVLDDADHPLTGLPGDDPAPLGHVCRSRLRGGDDEDLGVRQQLADGDRDVAGAGRHVEQEHVEVAEPHVGEELVDGPVQHRPTPGHRRGDVVDEHADRDDLHLVGDRRQDHAVDAGRAWRHTVLVGQAHQAGDAEAVHVDVDDAHALPAAGEGDRQVRRHRGLADAALAARHRDHAGQRVRGELDALRPALAQPRREGTTHGGVHHGHVDVDRRDTRDGTCGGPDVPFDGVGGRAPHDRELQVDAHRASRLDVDATDHVEPR